MSLIVLATLGFACTDDDIRSEHVLNQGPKIVGFAKSTQNIAYFEDLGVQENNVQVALIGRGDGTYPTSPLEVTYEVDLVKSTALEGVEFEFADDSRKVTIPAGGSFVNLPLLVNTGALNPTQKTELYLNLTSTTNAVLGAQYSTIKVVFVGCDTALEGPYAYGSVPVTITKLTPNTYHSNYFPPFTTRYFFDFSDVCGDLEIIDWQFQASNAITGPDGGPGTGFVEDNGNLTFENINVAGVAGYVNRTWTLVRQ
ncbi:hypothetical protein FEDK69T_16210 [Flavobacterium enshiense DK69]|uniref:DUF1735 domain-containing protein n=2 Tax=Flavobacterium TaxID=237 RepID=V6SGB5_9FLAO|nr:hypothetical protein FEDK69T_16210 [Flavobacterium enshiense DK69]KGO96324.1 hypothetical protein Q767_05260 [Flavobacterium enshiense DK69]